MTDYEYNQLISDDVLPPAVHTANEQLCITSTFAFVLKYILMKVPFILLEEVNVLPVINDTHISDLNKK